MTAAPHGGASLAAHGHRRRLAIPRTTASAQGIATATTGGRRLEAMCQRISKSHRLQWAASTSEIVGQMSDPNIRPTAPVSIALRIAAAGILT
jgi:GDP-D-mannose dehydratase